MATNIGTLTDKTKYFKKKKKKEQKTPQRPVERGGDWLNVFEIPT